MDDLSSSIRTYNYSSEDPTLKPSEQEVITEQSVALWVNGDLWLTFICSPINLKALTVGFLWNEHVIDRLKDIQSIDITSTNDIIKVNLNKPVDKPLAWHRTSTGIAFSHEIVGQPVANHFEMKAEKLISLYENFISKQTLYKSIGGFHSAALSDGRTINLSVEDVGRHNCLDKLAGLLLLNDKPLTPHLVLLTGRISSEMVHKSLRMNAAFLISRTTPTANAVKTAMTNNLTIIGYLRSNKFTIYSRPERVLI